MCTCKCPYPLCQAVSERPIASKSCWRLRVVAPLPICFTIIIYLFIYFSPMPCGVALPEIAFSKVVVVLVYCCYFRRCRRGNCKKSSEYFRGGGKGGRKTAKMPARQVFVLYCSGPRSAAVVSCCVGHDTFRRVWSHCRKEEKRWTLQNW